MPYVCGRTDHRDFSSNIEAVRLFFEGEGGRVSEGEEIKYSLIEGEEIKYSVIEGEVIKY